MTFMADDVKLTMLGAAPMLIMPHTICHFMRYIPRSESYGRRAAAEMRYYKSGPDAHGYVGGYGGPFDAHVKYKYEYRCENDVTSCPYEHRYHGLTGIARCSHDIVEAVHYVHYEHAGQYVGHEVMGVGQCGR